MKYISPKYEINELKSKDVITSSILFDILENEENDKAEYEVSPDLIFGN